MRALAGLAELHLVAQQHDVARALAHGDEVGQADLARLVDEQIVERLLELGAGEQPRGAGHQLMARRIDVLVVEHILDLRAAQAAVVAGAGGFLGAAQGKAFPLGQPLQAAQQIVDGVVAVGRYGHAPAGAQQLQQHPRTGVGLAGAGRPLQEQGGFVHARHDIQHLGQQLGVRRDQRRAARQAADARGSRRSSASTARIGMDMPSGARHTASP